MKSVPCLSKKTLFKENSVVQCNGYFGVFNGHAENLILKKIFLLTCLIRTLTLFSFWQTCYEYCTKYVKSQLLCWNEFLLNLRIIVKPCLVWDYLRGFPQWMLYYCHSQRRQDVQLTAEPAQLSCYLLNILFWGRE